MERDVEQLNSALNSIKTLKSNVRCVFESVSNGFRADHGEDGKENKFILELQDLLTTIRVYSPLAGNILPINSFHKTFETFSTTKRRKTQTSNHNVSLDTGSIVIICFLVHFARGVEITFWKIYCPLGEI
ncbi:hypothetical protein BDFB_010467 [Asbolus verrucosus]|uniref:Uncharacterized protein n=1 Tax=Asbolus verrucosus TaxID=1661398 RepID=A0A482WCR6_ASBVE|nr:hypothetical protein BDFB_010467 [Asbolus verrucosus]